MKTASSPESPELRKQRVLKELRAPGKFYKKAALDEALALRAELTPELLKILDGAATRPNPWIESKDDSLPYAAHLLSFWEEEKAFPIFLKYARFDDATLEKLWGDMVTEDFQTFLYRTGKAHTDSLKKLALDPDAYVYIRAAALGALNWCVAAEISPRDEIQLFYLNCFNSARTQTDHFWLSLVLGEWLSLHPSDHLQTIQDAYEAGKIDIRMIGTAQVILRDLREGSWEKALKRIKTEMARSMKDDIHSYTKWWAVSDQPTAAKLDLNFEAVSSAQPFAKLLKALGVDMPYFEVRAYLLGIILGIQLVPPSHCIAEILLQDTEGEIILPDGPTAKRFYELFMELWNSLAAWPNEGPPPVFEPLPTSLAAPSETESKVLTLLRRKEEVEAMLVGFAETDTFEDTIEMPEAKAAYRWLDDYAERLEKLSTKLEPTFPAIEPKVLIKLEKLLAECDQLWPKHYKALETGLRKQRGAALGGLGTFVDQRGGEAPAGFRMPVEAELKVGRNDACPCGSGKKFKKCCLH